jgi:hypothetical protein
LTNVRYTRQVRLAEVGVAGQARLETTEATVGGDERLSSRVCARYLESAGVRVTRGTGTRGPEMPAWVAALDPSAREVATGAYEALSVMRAALLEGAS